MGLSFPLSIESYAIWMAVWIALWSTAAVVWLTVHSIRRGIRAYEELPPAERIVAHARKLRDEVGKPMLDDMRRWQRKTLRRWRQRGR